MVVCNPEVVLSQAQRYEIGGICIVTAIVGFIGAALQLRSLRQFKNRQRRRPSANPDIIFYLALSDLIFCVGVFASAILLIILAKPNIPQRVSEPIAVVTESIWVWGCLASSIWTFCFALDMCFQLYRIECAMVVYHILAWAISLELVVVMEGGRFYHHSNWCQSGQGPVTRTVLFDITTVFVIVANPAIFCLAYRKVKQLLRSSGSYTNVERAALYACRRKFFLMVTIFIVCWLPNLIFSILFLRMFEKNEINKSQITSWYFMSSLVPLQGILNYFLYRRAFRVTATDTRRRRDSLLRLRRLKLLLQRERSRMLPYSLKVNQSVQKNYGTLGQDKETAPLVISDEENENPTSAYVYTCRLLGE